MIVSEQLRLSPPVDDVRISPNDGPVFHISLTQVWVAFWQNASTVLVFISTVGTAHTSGGV